MTPADACRRCGAPAPGATLCQTCTAGLRQALAAVPDVHADLTITRTRQDRLTSSRIGVVTRAGDTGLPWAQHASAALEHLRTVLVAEVRHQVESRRLVWPHDGIDAMAAWLHGHIGALRVDEGAVETYEAVVAAVRRCRRVIDRPPERTYAGPCATEREDGTECDADLRAIRGASHVRCTECGATHDAAARREWLLAVAQDRLLPYDEMAEVVSFLLGRRVPVDTLRSWVSRLLLSVAVRDRHDRPLLNVGETARLAMRMEAKSA